VYHKIAKQEPHPDLRNFRVDGMGENIIHPTVDCPDPAAASVDKRHEFLPVVERKYYFPAHHRSMSCGLVEKYLSRCLLRCASGTARALGQETIVVELQDSFAPSRRPVGGHR
jgi:hypothetical protein